MPPQAGPAARNAPSFWRNPAQWLRAQKLCRDYWWFFAIAFFYDAGFSIYVFLFNLFLLDFHFNERMMGLIGSSMTLGTLAGMLPAGIFARKFGLRPLFLFCLIGGPLMEASRALWVWTPAQLVLAFLAGLAMCSWGVCFLSAVARLTTDENRTAGFSIIFSASICTSALGGIVCGYLQQWLKMAGIAMQPAEVKRLILLASCGIALMGLIPLLRLRLPPQPAEEEPDAQTPRLSWLRTLRLDPFLLRFLPMMALWSAILAAFTPFANIYLTRVLHIPLTRIGLLFTTVQGIQLCLGILTPLIFRLLGLVNGIVATQMAAAIALASMAGAGNGKVAVGFYLAFSAAQWMSAPGLYNLLMSETPDRNRSTAAAMTMFCNALAGSIATALSGSLLTRFGYPRVLLGIATVAVTVAILFRTIFHPSASRAPEDPQIVPELLP